jgi:hypothetical protein
MRKSIDQYKAEQQCDVAVFHHVDGCYTVIGRLPEGAEVSSVCYTADNKRLIIRDIARLSDMARDYQQGFFVLDEPATCADKPKAKKSKKKALKADDELVVSMTEEPNP